MGLNSDGPGPFWFTRAGRHIGKEEYAEAIEILSQVPASDPDFGMAKLFLGMCHAWSGDLERARTNLLEALDADPADYQALRELTRITYHAGRIDEARTYARRALLAHDAELYRQPRLMKWLWRQVKKIPGFDERVIDPLISMEEDERAFIEWAKTFRCKRVTRAWARLRRVIGLGRAPEACVGTADLWHPSPVRAQQHCARIVRYHLRQERSPVAPGDPRHRQRGFGRGRCHT